ncbi:MFS transporter [Candidatus Woesearchaeota archaeon]|nr:MFS transporter [Candidatus Woesearchaeota archaeon]
MFQPKKEISKQELEKGLRFIIWDGIASQTMATLTGGVFLVAFALYLGASNMMIGLLAALPPLMQLLQLPSAYLVEKFRNRKKISVMASLLSRLSLIIIIAIPFLFSARAGLFALVFGLAMHAGFAAISGCSWNTWMHDLIPRSRLGAFFSKRLSITTFFELFISIGAGFLIDFWLFNFPKYGSFAYSVIFTLALFAGLLGLFFLNKTPEPKMNYVQKNLRLIRLITKPLKDMNFRNLIVYMSSWNFAVNLAAPFFTVYLIQRLNFNITYVIGFQILTSLVNIFFLGIWGRFSEDHNNKTILSISSPLFIFSILLWTFTTLPQKHFFTLPLLILIHVLMGATLAGIRLASGNISFKLSPKEDSTSYLAAASFVNSLSAGIAPLVGGIFADFFANRQLSLTLSWMAPGASFAVNTFNLEHWDFFFFLAFLFGLYSLHRLSKVEEEGNFTKKMQLSRLIAEIRKEMRNLSTISGLRPMIKFPALVITRIKRKNRKK